jgi:hypothetical protein
MKTTGAQRILALATAAVAVAVLPARAAGESELRAVRGTTGYEASSTAPFTRVFGHIVLSDDAIAITRPASNALIVLPDSSEVALGPNADVRVGAFRDATADTPTTLTLRGGALRFDVRHPAGGRANYRFETTTSQIAVRGTIGLYATGPNGDVVSCLACAPGDVVVTVGAQTYTLVTGQTLTISLAGLVTTAAATVAAQTFAGTGLATDASAATPFTGSAGVASAGAAAVPAAVYPVAGAAFAAGAAAAITSANSHAATPQITPATAPVTKPTPMPTQAPTPSVGNGNATLTGVARKR